jgi:uncharacterized protein (TIGR03435 family)
MAVEAIFWFHPLVWWIGSRMVEERELACDEEVLRLGCEPVDYVEGILKVCRFYTESPLPCISGVTGADVKRRLRAILEGSIAIELNAARKITLATIALASLTAPVLIGIWVAPQSHAQDAAGPIFEIASVKQNKTGVRGGRLNTDPGQLTITNINLRTCIKAAYRLQDYQLSGGNAGIEDEPYDIVAKAASPVGDDQLMLMLRSLLADRFKLKFHRESKELPGYALVVEKNGPKLHEVEVAGKGWSRNGVGSIDGQEVSMSHLAEILAGRLGRPVVNLTGINGVFDVKLKWTPDPATVKNPAENKESPAVDSMSDPSGPSIFSALQEQLGLRLEPRKLPDEILVIDHLERPSEN